MFFIRVWTLKKTYCFQRRISRYVYHLHAYLFALIHVTLNLLFYEYENNYVIFSTRV